MGQTPTTVNKPAQTTDEIIHAAVFEIAVQMAEAAIISEMPLLGIGIFRVFFHSVLNYLAKFVYVSLARFATFQIIDLQTSQEKAAYAKAEGDLRLAQLSGDAHAIDQATEGFRKALSSLVHFDGSASA